MVAGAEEHSGSRLVAFFVAAGEATALEADLRAFAAARLPDVMVPSAWVALDACRARRTASSTAARCRAPRP